MRLKWRKLPAMFEPIRPSVEVEYAWKVATTGAPAAAIASQEIAGASGEWTWTTS
jgi:hypothetical protein